MTPFLKSFRWFVISTALPLVGCVGNMSDAELPASHPANPAAPSSAYPLPVAELTGNIVQIENHPIPDSAPASSAEHDMSAMRPNSSASNQ